MDESEDLPPDGQGRRLSDPKLYKKQNSKLMEFFLLGYFSPFIITSKVGFLSP